ncbi:MAG: urea ABC transporter permease subunit UrtB [Bauldia sp.]|nr:urea ABC transporter permease subunit UrtB [Bauldia sp.]
MRFVLSAFVALLVSALTGIAPAAAQTDLRALINALGAGGFPEIEAGLRAITQAGDSAAVPAVTALGEGDLYVRTSDSQVVIAIERARGQFALTDAVTGESLGEAAEAEIERIRLNNRVRRAIRDTLGALTLMSDNPATRLAAAQAVLRTGDSEQIPLLDTAIAQETDARVLAVMNAARAVAIVRSDRPDEEKIEAINLIAERGGRDAVSILGPIANIEGPVGDAASAALAGIENTQRLWAAGQNVWYGLSLGSVLLLAAIGLAITFGVMGVINMAHGEMVMIGAYTTFVVQEIIRTQAPWLFDWSLAIAIPLAFLVAGTIGVAIERGIIRFLYGRPLETLLATWGLSLILQQAVRTYFGPTNKQVGNPSWMSGSFELGGLTIAYGRMWIIVFALAVFAGLMILMRATSFGLRMRAVTQNRKMASAMGIRTPWIDAMTFGLGSGIAGMAGVALSQIDNVSPNLGQSYIIDSFMVVVFGGVGNLWGTLVGAFTLGIANKFLEPYAGAVLGKILVLVLIILFIQRRPRGLFALKGRAVEA